jgi:hypothetical protein
MRMTLALPAAAVVIALAGCVSPSEAVSDDGDGSAVVSAEQGAASDPGTPESAPSPPIEVVGHGFSEVPPGEYSTTTYTPYAAVFANPDMANFVDAQVRFVFKDAAGTVLASEEDFLTAVFPGGEAALSGQLMDVEGVAAMEVQVLPGVSESAHEGVQGFVVDQINSVEDEWGGITTTARVTSPFTKDLTDLTVNAVYRNANGDIIGGAWTFLSFVPAQGSTGLEVTGTDLAEAPASTDVYVGLSNLTLLENG